MTTAIRAVNELLRVSSALCDWQFATRHAALAFAASLGSDGRSSDYVQAVAVLCKVGMSHVANMDDDDGGNGACVSERCLHTLHLCPIEILVHLRMAINDDNVQQAHLMMPDV